MREEQRWEEIIPEKYIPIIKWFQKKLLPYCFHDLDELLQQEKWKALYKAWGNVPWTSYYEASLDTLGRPGELALDLSMPNSLNDVNEIKNWFFKMLQHIYKASTDGISPDKQKAGLDYLRNVLLPFRLQMFVGLTQLLSLAKFHESVSDLIHKAREGDSDAMFKLIKLDKSFLEFDPIARKIRFATLHRESEFFNSLSNAVKVNFYKKGLSNYVNDLVIYIFWNLGFDRYGVTLSTFNDFLSELGIGEYGQVNRLKKRLQRLGLTKFTKNK